MKNIRRNTSLAGCLTLLALVWLATLGFTNGLNKAATELARARAKTTSVLFAEQVASTLAYIDSLLKVTARDMLVRAPGTTLKSIIDENPFAEKNLVLLSYVDAKGIARETENGPADPVDLSDREHIRVHLDAAATKPVGLFIGKPVLGRVSKRWSIQITRGVYDKTGALHGVLVYSLDPQYFERFVQRVDLGELDRITLFGADAVVRMQSENTLGALAATARRDDLVVQANEHGPSAFEEQDGARSFVSYLHPIPDFGLFVSTRVSMESVLARTFERRRLVIIAGLFISLLICWMAFYVYRSASSLETEVQRRTAELEKAVLKLDQMSQTDPLTQTPNRRAFDAKLKEAHLKFLAEREPYALLILDVDHFKKINDSFGHDVGDMVLCGISAFITKHVRKQDFFARIGGEEFALIMPATNLEESAEIADRIRGELCSYRTAGHVVTLSIGIAGPRDGVSRTQIYREADQALYMAKMAGRNRIKAASDATLSLPR